MSTILYEHDGLTATTFSGGPRGPLVQFYTGAEPANLDATKALALGEALVMWAQGVRGTELERRLREGAASIPAPRDSNADPLTPLVKAREELRGALADLGRERMDIQAMLHALRTGKPLPKLAILPEPPILFRPVRGHNLPPPRRGQAGDAGLDLPLDLSTIDGDDSVRGVTNVGTVRIVEVGKPARPRLVIEPGGIAWVRTGWAVAIPEGYEGEVRGRSGLAFKQGVTIWHNGTIDAGYRGELWVSLRNDGQAAATFDHGDRVAQLVVKPVCLGTPELAEELPSTARGEAGFGSTGR